MHPSNLSFLENSICNMNCSLLTCVQEAFSPSPRADCYFMTIVLCAAFSFFHFTKAVIQTRTRRTLQLFSFRGFELRVETQAREGIKSVRLNDNENSRFTKWMGSKHSLCALVRWITNCFSTSISHNVVRAS